MVMHDRAVPDPLPDWLEPMAATLTQERFTGPEWIFERKFDGIRLLAYKRGADVRLFSRNRLPQHLPHIADAIASLPVADAILDGELDWSGGGYQIFDVMWLDGRDVRALPLVERRALLKTLPLEPPLHRVAAVDDPIPWERARDEGWEGVIAKRRDSTYEHRRSRHWLKMKIEASQEFVVGGFTDPQGTRVGLGALLVGYYEGRPHRAAPTGDRPHGGAPTGDRPHGSAPTGGPHGAATGDRPHGAAPGDRPHETAPTVEPPDFVFAGKIGTGFDTKLLLDLRARLDRIEIPKPPFTKGTGLPRVRAHWVKPEIVVQVAFIEWTVHGKLRHPRLVSVRFDSST